ncbi:MAG TPA: metalloregulator ArsR/SmtB family transcription factor [Flavilitoribacter sp.]|nr:metalloregulator ArsR/SmtB family transcription factor [Flavilitoribacter sp.]HMQ88213.1 metalloregulator ArsR/SmtB family transcription factor [Flavilitoribacter sp.]
MGTTKSTGFSKKQNDLVIVLRAMAHPARLAIIQHLLKVNSCIGGELVDELPLAQPTVSRHLKELKDAGIIKGTIDGVKVNYCINSKKWNLIREQLDQLFATSVKDNDCC